MTNHSSNAPTLRAKLFRPPVASGFLSRSPLLLIVLLMILSLSAPLSARAEETHLPLSANGQDASVGTGRADNRPVVFLANDNLPSMTYM